MDLGVASSYFSDTPISGWNGSAWVPNVTTVTLLPYDRFISEREFGNKRRFLLVRPGDTALTTYPVIKFTQSGDVYMVGAENADISVDHYSRAVLIHRANYFSTLYNFTKTTAASGMSKTATRASLGQYWCDVERVTFANSKEFDGVSFSQMTLTLPRDCPADTDNELKAGTKFYDIKESFMSAGFRQCRGLAKRSV